MLAPLPTILVTTRSPEGDVNAAPFSFTMPVSVKPPLVALASVPSHHTFQNLKDTGEMVINIPSAPILEKLWYHWRKVSPRCKRAIKRRINSDGIIKGVTP